MLNATVGINGLNPTLTIRYEEQDTRRYGSMQRRLEEFLLVEQPAVQAKRERLWVAQAVPGVHVLLEHPQGEHGEGGVEEVVNGDEHGVQYCL